MLIAFDVDGTLFDTKSEIISALNIVFLRHGIDAISAEEANFFIGPPLNVSLVNYRNVSEEIVKQIIQEYRNEYLINILNSKMYPHVAETLSELSNIKLCIATNKPANQVIELLKHNHILQYFCVTKDKQFDNERKIDTLQRIKKSYPDEDKYIMVGDTEGDFKAAWCSDFEFVEAEYGYGTFEEENKLVIHKFNELLTILK